MNEFIKEAHFNHDSAFNYVINGIGYKWEQMQDYILEEGGEPVNYDCMKSRLGRNPDLLKALTTPVKFHNKWSRRDPVGPVVEDMVRDMICRPWR